MNKRFYYILIGLLFGFSFMSNVFADTSVSVNASENNVSSGTDVSVMVNVKSDVPLASCVFQISSDDGIVLESKTGTNGWEIDNNKASVGMYVGNSSQTADLSNGVNVLELKYSIMGSGDVTVNTLNCVDNDGKEISNIGSNKVSFSIIDTTLDSLVIPGGKLVATFSSTRLSYDVKLDKSTFGISYATTDSDLENKVVVKHNDKIITNVDEITFLGDDQGVMVISIIVGEETTYTLYVKYEQTDFDNTLKSVTIDGKELVLEKDKYVYEYTVSKDVSSVVVEAVLNDSKNFKFNAAVGNFPESGKNTFSVSNGEANVLIVIDPKDSSIGVAQLAYNITIKRASANNNKPVVDTGTQKPNVNQNVATGDISVYVMLLVLFGSLIGSIVLYQKKIDGYK